MKFSNSCKLIIGAVLAVTLSGCVSLRVGKVEQNFSKQSVDSRRQKLRAIKNFQALGAISITTPQKTYLVNYVWRQQGSSYWIKLTSSLNAVSYEIFGNSRRVTLRRARQRDVSAHSVNVLLQRELGYSLPLAGLRYWILGLPASGEFTSSNDKYGHLYKLQQQGWRINYLLYQSYDGMDLPRLMRISGHDLQIKLVIKKWQF